MNIYICPICGRGGLLTRDDWDLTGIIKTQNICAHCEREVIPLATPQIEENK